MSDLTNRSLGEGHSQAKAILPSRLIRLPEVMDRVGLRRSTIYHRMKEGKFPRSRSLGLKCAVWIESEIDDWINEIQNH